MAASVEEPSEPAADGNIDVKVLNLAGTEVAHLKGLSGTTSVRDIKRRLESQLKEEKKFSPTCLQCLCYKDQSLIDTNTCESLGWKDETDDIVIYLTRLSVDIDKCLSILWNSENRSKASHDLDFQEIEKLCAMCEDIFQHEPMLLEVPEPLTLVGNIHGHFEQLLKIFEQLGTPSTDRPYLFLGGYVDKGPRSVDTMALLFLYKAQRPENLFLLRSNHEDPAMSRMYGFYSECKKLHNIHLWKAFCKTFNMMPVAALVANRIFCVHGGLSPDLKTLDDIRQLERPAAVPETGLLCDLVWADPAEETTGWNDNDRGVSYTFGEDVAKQFVSDFGLELVVRSHQVVEGYKFFADEKVVTLWSVPRFKGMEEPFSAAVLVLSEGKRSFEILRD